MQRPYAKGRDLYDLMWYLSDRSWPAPNLTLLNNALRQTKWTGDYPAERTWREVVRRRLRGLDWDQALADVAPFLESGSDPSLLTEENVMRLLGR